MLSTEQLNVLKKDLILTSFLLLSIHIAKHYFNYSKEGLFDNKFRYASLALLVGFAFYNIFVAQYVNNYLTTTTFAPSKKNMISDIMKFSTVFIVQEFLVAKIYNRPLNYNEKWMIKSSFTIVGYLIFDYIEEYLQLSSYTPPTVNIIKDSLKLGLGLVVSNYAYTRTLGYVDLINAGSAVLASAGYSYIYA